MRKLLSNTTAHDRAVTSQRPATAFAGESAAIATPPTAVGGRLCAKKNRRQRIEGQTLNA